ncbi:phosphatidylinositol N-acetylglucosaminyltransferase [Chloropicon primus]|nr:phosphatidylinositol N-acetylglucosaminyltransferase [Chloropicon primus]
MRVMLVSDYFHPSVGGVETHMYNLAENLTERGNKVVVMTCARGGRCGVRYLRGGVKVYHVPRVPVFGGTTMPSVLVLGTLRIFRAIAVRERIELVHSHQTSTLALECLFHAKTMGLRTVYTCHSLHGFADVGSILLNKVLKISCVNADAVVCVSNVSKENMVLRASIPPEKVFVIPNAVHTSVFSPRRKLEAMARDKDLGRGKSVVVVSRLVYRKGIDLLAQILGEACRGDPDVSFTIVGDGPKRELLEGVVRANGIQDRVHLVGNLPHEEVIRVLEKGNVFLNLSLTEAFGMAMLEAASVGLLVVSTSVGGVPEIFPALKASSSGNEGVGMILCKPEAGSILRALGQALRFLPRTSRQIKKQHDLVRVAYNWEDVAARTEKVYQFCDEEVPKDLLYERICKSLTCGAFMGPIYSCLIMFHVLYYHILKALTPRIELAWDSESAVWVGGNRRDTTAACELNEEGRKEGRMHPPLVLHRNPQCRDQILALQDCHREHPISKFWGSCNDVKFTLDACFRKQKDFKRKVNFAKAKAEKERFARRMERQKQEGQEK